MLPRLVKKTYSFSYFPINF